MNNTFRNRPSHRVQSFTASSLSETVPVGCLQYLHSIQDRSFRMDMQITCKSCELKGIVYAGPVGSFYIHNSQYHLEDSFRCKFCPTLFSTLEERDFHMNQDHKEFPCVQCHKDNLENIFMERDEFKTHYFHQHDDCKLKCDTCPNQFHLEGQRKDHMKLWHWYVEAAPKIKCENCADSLATRMAMLRHTKSKHTKEKFLCPNCNTGFRQETNRNLHAENCKIKYD